MIITEPAAKMPRLLERSEANMPYMPTARVFCESSVRKIEPIRNSLIEPTRASSRVVARIGVMDGTRIRLKVCQWVAPSMMAASSSSLGMVSKKPLISQTWPRAPPSRTAMYPGRVFRPSAGTASPRSEIIE